MAFGYKAYNPDEDKEYQKYLSDVNTALQNGVQRSAATNDAYARRQKMLDEGVTHGDAYNTALQKKTALGDYSDKNGYGAAMSAALDKYKAWGDKGFDYDLNADALYQQYKNMYMQQGKLAMQDTVAQASALTGGYGNSYAATAGNQAYQSYLNQLNDIAPQLYEMAYNRYQDEGTRYQNDIDLYSGLSQQDKNDYYNQYDRIYNELRDANTDDTNMYNTRLNAYTTDYTTGLEQDTNAYNNKLAWAQTMANNTREWNNQANETAQEWAYKNYQEALAAASGSGSGSGSGGKTKSTNTDTAAATTTNGATTATNSFIANNMTSQEYLSRNRNKTFSDYKLSIKSNINKMANNGKITQDEYNYLMDYYGL